jgi:hypothetical protein
VNKFSKNVFEEGGDLEEAVACGRLRKCAGGLRVCGKRNFFLLIKFCLLLLMSDFMKVGMECWNVVFPFVVWMG